MEAEMKRKEVFRMLRPRFSRLGLILLAYYGIMNAAVSLVLGLDILGLILDGVFTNNTGSFSIEEHITELVSNGWGYILATSVGFLILLLWKKGDYCFRFLWKKEKRMDGKSFFVILCVFLSGQAVFQLLGMGMEWFFNQLGFSVMDSIEAASGLGDTLSMFLYGCIFAPVFEEILFRGFLLRSLAPYGKKFAIFASSFFFGIFHANIVQSPFAFAVGLVLGYVTVEYSMVWAVVLHMFNNLVMGDLLPRLVSLLAGPAQDIVMYVIIGSIAVVALVICICKRRQLRQYLYNARIHPWCIASFLSAPGVLIITGVMACNVLLTFLMQLI
jgi:membrane protease YdiL (CAAX protease family)